MNATRVFGAAILLGVVGRWANNKKALPGVQGSLEVLGALFLVAFMDRGKTQPVAKGLAWLFLAAVLLSDSSPITGLARAETSGGRVPNAVTGGGPFPGEAGAGRVPTPATGGAPFPGAGYTARATPTPRRTG